MKICVSVTSLDEGDIEGVLEKAEMAEFRLDRIGKPPGEFGGLWKRPLPKIATFRKSGFSDTQRRQWLVQALELGSDYIDLDLRNDTGFVKNLIAKAKSLGKQVILSYHNFEETPETEKLQAIIQHGFDKGANLVKIAAQVNHPQDNARLLGLYANFQDIVAIGMGSEGAATRLASLFCGAPFTYASADKAHPAAPGQIDFEALTAMRNQLDDEKRW